MLRSVLGVEPPHLHTPPPGTPSAEALREDARDGQRYESSSLCIVKKIRGNIVRHVFLPEDEYHEYPMVDAMMNIMGIALCHPVAGFSMMEPWKAIENSREVWAADNLPPPLYYRVKSEVSEYEMTVLQVGNIKL